MRYAESIEKTAEIDRWTDSGVERPKNEVPKDTSGPVPGMCTIWANKGKVTNLLA